MQFFRKMFVGFLIFTIVASPSLASFDDVKDALSPDVVQFLQAYGVGKSTANFFPKRPISLVEFLAMGLALAGVKDLGGNATTRFTDVPADAWFAPVVAKADELDLLGDFRGTTLLPNRVLSRGEVAELGLKIFGIGVPTAANNEEFGFKDVGKNYRFARFIFRAVKMGVLDPISDTEFGTARRVSRGEAAQFFYNLANFVEGPSIVIQTGTTNIPEFVLFQHVWDEAKNRFLYPEKANDSDMLYSAIQGMVKSLDDPYSEFYTPEETKSETANLSGEVEGIGVYIEADPQNRGLVIVAPVYSSPAERAGLRAGDIITAVDGKPLADLPLADAANLTRGPTGTTAKYTILRDGQEFTVEIIRQKIKLDIATVEFQNDIAIIDINQFTTALPEDFAKIAAQISEHHIRGIILDLRNNGGGLVNAAVDLLGYFLPKGTLVASQEFRPELAAENLDYKTERDPTLSGIRTLVLVNKGTASASEIVAAALQDYGAASILGEQTFGKGVVQEINFFNDGTALKMTVAHWLSPKKQEIQGVGVKPDFAAIDVPETPTDEAIEAALAYF